MKSNSITIDADGKILGKVATRAANILSGKLSADYEMNKVASTRVIIYNVSKIKLSGKKNDNKYYKSYSGYPGGLKHIKYSKAVEKNPSFPLRNAIRGMLPKNKLLKKRMSNLSLYTHAKEN